MDNKVVLNGKNYEISPLKCRHLREITKILKEVKEEGSEESLGIFSKLDRWIPYIVDSIKVKHPDFTKEELDESTLAEYAAAWTKVIAESGIKVVNAGETKPASIGASSTDESVPASGGTTVN